MIDTLLFDMDGLLVDSEPWWKVAEKEVFSGFGLNLTDDLLRQVMGFRLNEVVKPWYHYQAWENPDFDATEEAIICCMEDLLNQHAVALPGVEESLIFAQENGYKIALASSSNMRLINVVIDKLNIRKYFEICVSADRVAFGKPHPAIFIETAHILGSNPKTCLVLEDSINGMIAAKAARMSCLVVPESINYQNKKFELADYKLETLKEFPTFLLNLK
jgi:sugar-phosphatase